MYFPLHWTDATSSGWVWLRGRAGGGGTTPLGQETLRYWLENNLSPFCSWLFLCVCSNWSRQWELAFGPNCMRCCLFVFYVLFVFLLILSFLFHFFVLIFFFCQSSNQSSGGTWTFHRGRSCKTHIRVAIIVNMAVFVILNVNVVVLYFNLSVWHLHQC